MAKKEAQTDLFVYKLLEEAGINLTYQGSDIKELNEALKNASKKELISKDIRNIVE